MISILITILFFLLEGRIHTVNSYAVKRNFRFNCRNSSSIGSCSLCNSTFTSKSKGERNTSFSVHHIIYILWKRNNLWNKLQNLFIKYSSRFSHITISISVCLLIVIWWCVLRVIVGTGKSIDAHFKRIRIRFDFRHDEYLISFVHEVAIVIITVTQMESQHCYKR